MKYKIKYYSLVIAISDDLVCCGNFHSQYFHHSFNESIYRVIKLQSKIVVNDLK